MDKAELRKSSSLKSKREEVLPKVSVEWLEKLEYPWVLSRYDEKNRKHYIVRYNSFFAKKFLFFLKREGEAQTLEELFSPAVFENQGLTFFPFEKRFYYIFNLFLEKGWKLHFFIEEEEWLKFPHWFYTERLASLGRLAGEISHEIKNPLSGILLYATMLKEELGNNPTYQEWINRIIHLSTRCQTVVEGLLKFGRLEQGKKEWINFNEVAKKVYKLLEDYPIFKDIEVEWNLYPKLPPFYANRFQIEQVFFNIFINAAEAMKGRGKITVETSLKNDNIVIKVMDTGPGIKSEIMPFIFDPFFTTKEKEKGTGLGLSICYGIVNSHRGKIKVYNLKNQGACFEITFPLQTREALREDEV